MPLFLAGAPVTGNYAFGPTTGAALNVTLVSYRGTCCIGCTIDTTAVPDPDVLVDCLRQGFDEVLDLGGEHRPARRPLATARLPGAGDPESRTHARSAARCGYVGARPLSAVGTPAARGRRGDHPAEGLAEQPGRRPHGQQVPGGHGREAELAAGPAGQDALGGADQQAVGGDLVGPAAHARAARSCGRCAPRR